MAKKVYIPDADPINVDDNLSVEQIRRNLVGLGFTQLETAQYQVERNGDIRFARAVGGEKGSR